MNRLIAGRKALAVITACGIAAGALSASADNAEDSVEENSAVAEQESTEGQSTSLDLSEYTDKLQELNDEQARIEQELADTDEDMQDETERQQLILEKIKSINEKADVINSYMTQLELEISTQRQQVDELKQEVDDGIEAYKKRLRAMYIAGEITYTEVLLNSGDFFDVLMRSELLKRVADYDARTLDSLVEKKNEYDEKLVTLQEEEAAYDEQSEELENQRAELAELYQSSQESKELLKQQKEDLAQQQETNANEIYSYEGTLSDLLKGTYGSSDDETQRMQTELDANSKLLELRTALSERVAAGETISDEECTYSFKWPVPNHYNVSSGVGERWGTYHKGLDITGESGTAIYAAEYGTVVRMNNSCTHNYGKSSSCGCGGGYGNYVIIDHGNGFLTLYGHLTQATVEVGDTVKRGDQIGLMGTTGYSTGTHLHFELRYNGYITNPASFLTLE